jgi:hypothetical protein
LVPEDLPPLPNAFSQPSANFAFEPTRIIDIADDPLKTIHLAFCAARVPQALCAQRL